MRYLLLSLILGGLLYGGSLFVQERNAFEVKTEEQSAPGEVAETPVEEQREQAAQTLPARRFSDIEPQPKLANPPSVIKALYATAWVAGSESRITELIGLIKETELNAIVIDIKDFSGLVLYDIDDADVIRYGAKEVRIPRVNALIKRLHDEGIYVIARITVFQDPGLAKARPDLALRNNVTGAVWEDHKKLAWIDPAAREAWDYNIAIAKDAASRGFDELNFDYIRFASDGDLSVIGYPAFEAATTFKRTVIRNFYAYLRAALPDERLSADLFGLVTVNPDDLGIGQVIEDAFPYFDAIAPMTYPSHYASGFLNYQNPGAYPYEVVRYSMEHALNRLMTYNKMTNDTNTTTTESSVISHKSSAKLRPWVQDFHLGATYDAAKVRAQITATGDAFTCRPVQATATSTPSCTQEEYDERFGGWMMWNPSNRYTRGALLPE